MIERDIIYVTNTPITIKQIIQSVAAKHEMTVEEMVARNNERRFVHARHEAMWELRQRTKLSLPQIARRLGRTDHSTAWHALRAHEARVAESREVAA